MRDAVRDEAKQFPTAIVSGPCINKVFSFVKLRELYYAGSHGMDIKGPSKRTKHTDPKAKAVLFQPASEFLPMMQEVYKKLVEEKKFIMGSRVEDNKFSLSVHFRCVDEKIWSSLIELVTSVLKEYPKLRLTLGRKVLEIRPSIKWDKGKALEFLLESRGFTNCSNVFPVYIGDDRTDEDAFKITILLGFP
ncbi:putative trehalose-phosphate phosphatase 6 [Canna indica]|uniref:Trehalose 6-phosphate phosphatase n=1 Tax=Canna indica TaxID=4628 RepID=A0AAQ3JXV9_9LILI|nr:putative trehalose-phosphate phosphatase 6 [Canna indica]